MTKVSGLYRIGLGVPNIDIVSEFYRKNWAMELVGVEQGPRVFSVAPNDAWRFDAAKRREVLPRPCCTVCQLGAARPCSLFWSASRARDTWFCRGPLLARTPVRPSRRLYATLTVTALKSSFQRKEVLAAILAQMAARRLGHVVLWSLLVQAQEEFYALLGFQVSDRTHVGMSFLRCNTDHHSIALARSARGKTGLQHVAFDVGSIDEVMRELGRLRSEGVDCVWGVGRHGPGNNVFSYYTDPAGNVIEYYGEMEKVQPNEKVARKFRLLHTGRSVGCGRSPTGNHAPVLIRDMETWSRLMMTSKGVLGNVRDHSHSGQGKRVEGSMLRTRWIWRRRSSLLIGLIKDGSSGLIVLGTTGECATLSQADCEAFVHCVVDVVARRVPLIVGTTALGSHEVARRLRMCRDLRVDGSLLGLPMWQPTTLEMAVQFYSSVSDAFSDLPIMVYANARAFRFEFC